MSALNVEVHKWAHVHLDLELVALVRNATTIFTFSFFLNLCTNNVKMRSIVYSTCTYLHHMYFQNFSRQRMWWYYERK